MGVNWHTIEISFVQISLTPVHPTRHSQYNFFKFIHFPGIVGQKTEMPGDSWKINEFGKFLLKMSRGVYRSQKKLYESVFEDVLQKSSSTPYP